MNSKRKGDIAELKVMLYFEENGYTVLTPFGDKARYDIVVEKNNQFKRLQVKYTSIRNGILPVRLASITTINGKPKTIKYTPDEIDSIIVYCPNNNNLYEIKSKEFNNKKEIYLRLSHPKNNSIKNINFANNYILTNK